MARGSHAAAGSTTLQQRLAVSPLLACLGLKLGQLCGVALGLVCTLLALLLQAVQLAPQAALLPLQLQMVSRGAVLRYGASCTAELGGTWQAAVCTGWGSPEAGKQVQQQ